MGEQLLAIGVCGAGAMGSGIAEAAARSGHRVALYDPSSDALSHAATAIGASLARRLSEADAGAVAERLTYSADIQSLAVCRVVIEAIVENAGIKTALFRSLEALLPLDAILATNTSSLSVSGLAKELSRPDRFAGMHFFNPVGAMKLVEIIRGEETLPEVAQTLFDLALTWGKSPALVRDVPGFIVNRVARPYYAEGFKALAEKVGSPAAIDYALRVGGGFRMGPLELSDFIGQDVNFAAASSVYAAYGGRTRFEPQAAQQALVEAGHLGRKTGRGVYEGAGGASVPEFLPDFGASLQEAEQVMRDAGSPRGAFIGDVGVHLADGRSAATVAAALRHPVVLLDWARASATSDALIFAASDDDAARAGSALASSLGRPGLRLRDRPGGLVLRTLAQIANAAYDAVGDQVAEPDDIDRAMKTGANYPEGPLSWAERFGLRQVVSVLNNIAEETGDSMYTPSVTLIAAARNTPSAAKAVQ